MSPLILLLFLPSFVCLFWLFTNFYLARRTSTFGIMQCFSLALLFYFMADGCYSTPGIAPEVLVYSRLFVDGAGPCLIPFLWLYFDKLRWKRPFHPAQFAWVIAPVAILIACIVFTEISDKHAIAEFLSRLFSEGSVIVPEYKGTTLWHFYIWSRLVFMVVIAVELVSATAYLLRYVIKEKVRIRNLWGYLFKGGAIRITELQIYNLLIIAIYIALKLIFLKSFLDTHIWLSVILAILVSFGYASLMYCSLYGEKERITRVQARHVMFFNYNPAIKGPIVEIMMEELMEEANPDILARFQAKLADSNLDKPAPKEISAVKEQLFNTASGAWDDSLLAKFQNLMLNEQLFLQPSLSLADVADRLRTNKTYVSKLVNNTYNMGFPELLNTLRVDYAQQYILSHRDAKQEEIASACGFLSASSFNNIFKKITGVTPKVWLVGFDNKK